MIPFKDIELKDKDLITSFTLNSPRRNCDLSFSNLCSWRFLYNTKFAIMDGFLLLKFWADGELVYMMPIGNGDLNKVLDALIEDANQEGEPFCLLGICAGMCSELETFMPGRFHFTADRDYADYVYLRSDLATLSGKLIITNILLLQPTVFKSASIWKRNGAKSTTATSMKVQATNVAH